MAAVPVAVLVYAAIASTAVAAYSAYSQGDNARKQQHTAADIKRQQAEEVSAQATQQVEQQRGKARSIIGQQLASTAQSGTGLTGSNLDLLNQSLNNNAMDSMNIRYGADQNANGLNMQSGINDANASNAQTGGELSAAGQLLKGAGSVYGSSYTQQGSTVPGWDLSNTSRGSGD